MLFYPGKHTGENAENAGDYLFLLLLKEILLSSCTLKYIAYHFSVILFFIMFLALFLEGVYVFLKLDLISFFLLVDVFRQKEQVVLDIIPSWLKLNELK